MSAHEAGHELTADGQRVNEAVHTCWLTEVCLTAFIYMEIVVVYIFVRLKIQIQTKVWPAPRPKIQIYFIPSDRMSGLTVSNV